MAYRESTSHFKNRLVAKKFYDQYMPICEECGQPYPSDVEEKIARGEIHIGKPNVSDDNALILLDSDGRYFIEYLDK